MIGNTIRLGRIFGVEIRLHYSWFVVFVLLVWSLAGEYFPRLHPGWQDTTYLWMGVLTALMFLGSVVAHELAHSLVSRANGVPVRDITVFIFGGAAHIGQEPRRPRDEFLMALAGPAASAGLAAVFGALWWQSQQHAAGTFGPLHAVAGRLGWINLALALFNLVPGFPLDGGRILRAAVWGATGNFRQATGLAAGVGRLVAFGFIFWGMSQIFSGRWADGLWMAFIGWFLDNAASATAAHNALEDLLAGHTAREVAMTDCPHVSAQLTLDILVDQVVLSSGRRCFPVVEDGQLHGLVTLHRVAAVGREHWHATRVEDVMIPRAHLKTVRPDDSLIAVLDRMTTDDVNQFPVMDNGQFTGMVARDNLLTFIRTRTELNVH